MCGHTGSAGSGNTAASNTPDSKVAGVRIGLWRAARQRGHEIQHDVRVQILECLQIVAIDCTKNIYVYVARILPRIHGKRSFCLRPDCMSPRAFPVSLTRCFWSKVTWGVSPGRDRLNLARIKVSHYGTADLICTVRCWCARPNKSLKTLAPSNLELNGFFGRTGRARSYNQALWHATGPVHSRAAAISLPLSPVPLRSSMIVNSPVRLQSWIWIFMWCGGALLFPFHTWFRFAGGSCCSAVFGDRR